jgi:hypothetical protein
VAALGAVFAANLSAEDFKSGWHGSVTQVVDYSGKSSEAYFTMLEELRLETHVWLNSDGRAITARTHSSKVTTEDYSGAKKQLYRRSSSVSTGTLNSEAVTLLQVEPSPAGSGKYWFGLALNGKELVDGRDNKWVTTRSHVETFSPTASIRDWIGVGRGPLMTVTTEGTGDGQPHDELLKGSETLPFSRQPTFHGKSSIKTTWNLSRKPEKLEVVVDIPKYDSWLPNAAPDESSPGRDALLVRATLRNKDGSAPKDKATRFTFELIQVSREPGICMNYPVTKMDGPRPEPDLQFDDRLPENKKLVIRDDHGQISQNGRGLKAETLPVPDGYTQAEAMIGCYDWGAYGVLQVTAEMPDGRPPIVGYLQQDKNNPLILIPKRQPGSHIADKWKEEWKAKVPNIFAMSDDDDSEDNPHGSKHEPGKGPGGYTCEGGHKGDGLTLYEEYRGVSVRAMHVRGDPSRKKVFIRRGANLPDDVLAGVSLFGGLTDLCVYSGLLQAECGPDESKVVVNSNTTGYTQRATSSAS